MPKKIDYQGELAILKDQPDNALRPITTRVRISGIRALQQLIDQGVVIREERHQGSSSKWRLAL
jgi:hypothetical protein